MKYNNYSIEDFASDPYFQTWVFEQNAMADKFWTDWLAEHPNKKETIAKARKLVLLLDRDEDTLSKEDFDAIWRNIIVKRDLKNVEHNFKKKSNKAQSWFLLKVAAVFIGLFTLGYTTYYFAPFSIKNSSKIVAHNKISLELEDGSIVYLEDTTSEIIESKTSAVASNKKKISYKNSKKISSKLVYNKITVPYGKIFEVELSDGSKVLLNSGSQLKYPVRFLKDTPRNVYLEGEAFFEVAKDKHNAFTVVTNKMNTRVYGTKFNVSCYANEQKTETVLVEGSVGVYKVKEGDANHPILIKPGFKALYKNKEIGVAKIDVLKYTAWTEDKLVFIDDSFEVIIKRLERKYNVNIDNQFSKLNTKKFTGFFKNEPLHVVLDVFRAHTQFNYKIEKEEVTITK
ncbi:FecR family protein [Wenyingzhuangia aestuarii]|uniref:FecR family protein n=1 Tax=Wenyingzhuangia aestuarii TaxID=1647582 RepID=UPI00143B82CA|nr:FecR family protein [Wenyingzhuangia aestuarii]NJB82705.1 hypothetical protein [Wenyingzhuangia aestuarii]